MDHSHHLPVDDERLALLRYGQVVATRGRCVQCGICSYNCPIGIDVRHFSRRGLPIVDPRCLRCGACVVRCPRGVLTLDRPEAA
jgi:ferredoxin